MQIQFWSKILCLAAAMLMVTALNGNLAYAQQLPKKTKKSKTLDTSKPTEPSVTVVGEGATSPTNADSAVSTTTSFNGLPVLHFNTSKGVPANTDKDKRDPFKFRAGDVAETKDESPTEEQIKVEVPEKLVEPEQAYKAHVGYPKHAFKLGVTYEDDNFSATLRTNNTLKKELNFYSKPAMRMSFLYSLWFSPGSWFDFGYSTKSVSAEARSNTVGTPLNNLTPTGSNSSQTIINLASYYCFFENKWCLGLGLERDSFIGYFYSSGTNSPNSVTIGTMTDFTAGPRLRYQTPSFWGSLFFLDMSYLSGLNQGQPAEKALKGNTRTSADMGWIKMFGRHGFDAIFTYDLRQYGYKANLTSSASTSHLLRQQEAQMASSGLALNYLYRF